tara:strand:+ start:201 stop:404 length:204 start_codon:yes stop_codon:yes gene_type:complete
VVAAEELLAQRILPDGLRLGYFELVVGDARGEGRPQVGDALLEGLVRVRVSVRVRVRDRIRVGVRVS